MSQAYISLALRATVADIARHRCGYCLTLERIVGALFTIDHIVPESLGGTTTLDNLCLACWGCNLHKNNRIAAVDPTTRELTRLYNPHTQIWVEHFEWQATGLLVAGITPTGRATVYALKLNRAPLVTARQFWIKAGWHPFQE